MAKNSALFVFLAMEARKKFLNPLPAFTARIINKTEFSATNSLPRAVLLDFRTVEVRKRVEELCSPWERVDGKKFGLVCFSSGSFFEFERSKPWWTVPQVKILRKFCPGSGIHFVFLSLNAERRGALIHK
jgi:hypothetical protein